MNNEKNKGYEFLGYMADHRCICMLCVFLFNALIIFIRRPDALLNAQPWAEDGEIFISQALLIGWEAYITTHAGYYHLIPRVVAFFSTELSIFLGQGITLAPLFMNLSAIIISAVCTVYLCSSRFDWVAHIYYRLMACALIASMPSVAFEIYGNITNVQWWIGLVQVLVTWDMVRNKRIPSKWELVILFIVSFSGPLGIFPALGIATLFLFERTKAVIGAVSLLWIGPIIQILTSLDKRLVADTNSVMDWLVGFPRLLFGGLFARNIVPDFRHYANIDHFSTLVLIGAIFFGVIVWMNRSKKIDLLVLLGIVFLYLVMVYRGAPFLFESYAIPFHDFNGRYLFIPLALIIVLIFRGFWLSRFSIGANVAATLIIVMMLIVDIKHFKLSTFEEFNWKEETKVYSATGDNICEIPINPNWILKIPCN